MGFGMLKDFVKEIQPIVNSKIAEFKAGKKH
jgi:hypothetical protein